MNAWQSFVSDVLDCYSPHKQEEQEILDLVSCLSMARFAAAQNSMGLRSNGFLYYHVGNLLISTIQACSARDIPIPAPSFKYCRNSVLQAIRHLTTKGVTKEFYSLAVDYCLFLAKEHYLDFDHLTRCALANLRKTQGLLENLPDFLPNHDGAKNIEPRKRHKTRWKKKYY